MGLNRSERLALTAIEQRLEREDVGLAHHLRTMTPPRRSVSGWLTLAGVGLVMLLLAAAAWAADGGVQHHAQRHRTAVAGWERSPTPGPGHPATMDPWTGLGQAAAMSHDTAHNNAGSSRTPGTR